MDWKTIVLGLLKEMADDPRIKSFTHEQFAKFKDELEHGLSEAVDCVEEKAEAAMLAAKDWILKKFAR